MSQHHVLTQLLFLEHLTLVGHLLVGLGLHARRFEGGSFEVEVRAFTLPCVQHQVGLLKEVLVIAVVARLLLLFKLFFFIIVSKIVSYLFLLLERTRMEVELVIIILFRLKHLTSRIRTSLVSHCWLLSHWHWRHSLVKLLQLEVLIVKIKRRKRGWCMMRVWHWTSAVLHSKLELGLNLRISRLILWRACNGHIISIELLLKRQLMMH